MSITLRRAGDTRIYDGSAVSGTFAPVDVVYFEVMVAFTHDSNAGIAILNACGSSDAWNLYVGPGSGLPGFVSMSIPVPAGCTAWSLSASGGYVDFRSVDANYVSPPPPVSTNTFTPAPTETFSPTGTMTPSPTATETLAPGVTPSDTPTPTDTPSPTSTSLSASTLTSTSSATLPPGVTLSPTGTMSDTPAPTSTSTPSQTLPPEVTPSDTPIPTNSPTGTMTPIPPVATNTPKPPSNGGQGGSGGFVLPTGTFTPSALPQSTSTSSPSELTPATSHMTPNMVETARVMIFGTSTPTPTPRPIGKAGKVGSGFPWWLLAAGGAAAYAVGKRKQIAQSISNYRMKIHERKRKALEAQWAQEKAAKEAQQQAIRQRAAEAKLTRMETEEGRKGAQASTPKPFVPTLSKFSTHAFSRKPKPAVSNQPKPTSSPAKPAGLSVGSSLSRPLSRPSLWNRFASGVKNLVAPLVNTISKPAAPSAKPAGSSVGSSLSRSLSRPSLWSRFTAGVKNLAAPLVNAVQKPAAPSSKPNLWSGFASAVKGTVKKIAPVVNTVKTKAVNVWNTVKTTAQAGWEVLKQTKQSLDDLWHRRSVRIALAAAAIAVAAPTFFTSVNLATYQTFHVPAVTWFGVGSENRGVETALANQTAIRDVVNNYNAAVASGTTFACEYNQKGKPLKECARSVEIQPILVEAAISVQSQWKIPWLDSSLARWIQGKGHSSEGIAQVSQPELDQWADNLKKYLPPGASLSPQDAHASAGAVIERIAPVLEYCQQKKCDANSRVIVAAMAQNGRGFTVETLENIFNPANAEEEKYLRADGSINWERYFEKQGPRPLKGNLSTILSRLMQNVRAVPGNFERQFMLQLYVNDLKLLQAKGETLPEGVDLEYLECLADRLPGASYHCESGKDN